MIALRSGILLPKDDGKFKVFSYQTENYIASLPFFPMVGTLLRLVYQHEDSALTGGTYDVKLYDEHDVDVLESLSTSLAAETDGIVELRHSYGSGLYGDIILDGQYTLYVETDGKADSYGTLRFLFQ